MKGCTWSKTEAMPILLSISIYSVHQHAITVGCWVGFEGFHSFKKKRPSDFTAYSAWCPLVVDRRLGNQENRTSATAYMQDRRLVKNQDRTTIAPLPRLQADGLKKLNAM